MKKVLNSIGSFNVRNAFQLSDDIISLLTEVIRIVRTELARFPIRVSLFCN